VIEDMYGYDYGQPLRHMREYLAVLLPLLDRRPVSFTGTTVRANVGLSVPGEGRVPVLLAALGTQMLTLAGQQAEGTVLWMTGPATVRDHVAPTLTAAAAAAGRPSPRVVCILPVCVTDDPAAARERASKIFSIYGELPSYRAMLDREGATGPGDVAVVGDEDAVAAQIRGLAEAGVTDFVAGAYARGDEAVRTRALLRSLQA
jgi:F420-dependent oxidoreductase-like protein